MRQVLAGGLTAMAALAPGCVTPAERGGPMPVRNQHPAQLTQLHLPPAATTPMPAGAVQARLDAAYSSLFLLGARSGTSWIMDGEYLRVGLRGRVGLGAGFELAGELPFAHTSGGFLDAFVIDYHDWFGMPDQGRDTSARDQFEIEARRNGRLAWQVEPDSAELLDVPVYVSWQAMAPAPGRPGVAGRAGVELPTGDDERGYGSGGLDASLGIVLEYHTGPVSWYAHGQHTFASTPDPARRAGLDFADVTSAGLAAELPLLAQITALVQVEWETSTLRRLDVPVAQRDQVLLWVGGRWRAGSRWSVEVGFGEDLQSLASPDFTAWLGVAYAPIPGDGP